MFVQAHRGDRTMMIDLALLSRMKRDNRGDTLPRSSPACWKRFLWSICSTKLQVLLASLRCLDDRRNQECWKSSRRLRDRQAFDPSTMIIYQPQDIRGHVVDLAVEYSLVDVVSQRVYSVRNFDARLSPLGIRR